MTLPNFMMIGVAKAGTTSFFRYLDQHPQIYMAPIKATNFFGYEDARDWKWAAEGDPPLLQNFPVRTFEAYEASFAGATDERAIGGFRHNISVVPPQRSESTNVFRMPSWW